MTNDGATIQVPCHAAVETHNASLAFALASHLDFASYVDGLGLSAHSFRAPRAPAAS